jgi:hypothetical protein
MSAGSMSQRQVHPPPPFLTNINHHVAQVETTAPSGIGAAAVSGGRMAYSGRVARVEASNPLRKLTVALLDTYKRVNEV